MRATLIKGDSSLFVLSHQDRREAFHQFELGHYFLSWYGREALSFPVIDGCMRIAQ